MEKISHSVDGFCHNAALYLTNEDPKCKQEDTPCNRFYARVIKLYTKPYLHDPVNDALKREGLEKWNPSGDDEEISPYALLLDVLLFYWTPLTRFSGTSYRGMNITPEDLEDKYAVGTQFVWMFFVSSAMEESAAFHTRNTLFIIDNSVSTPWQPRVINFPHLSEYWDSEKEALYPAGAEFRITSKSVGKKNHHHPYENVINLKLMNPRLS